MAYFARYMLDEHGQLRKVVINAGVGFVLPYYGETAPPGTLACDGSEISRATYDELFQVLGTKAGAGDGSTTFNLPDFRGDFIRGLGGENAGEIGVAQEDAIRDIKGMFHLHGGNADGSGTGIFQDASGAFALEQPQSYYINTIPNRLSGVSAWWSANFIASSIVPTAAENSPVNVALLWCIIYE